MTPTRLVAALGLAAGLLACAPGRSQEQSAADPLALVERLIDERPWTRRGVERTTGVALVPNEAAANRYYSLWISERGAGSLARVELREAGPEATRGGLLILDLDPEAAGLPLARIPERFGRDFAFEPPSPHAPPDAPAYYTYRRKWGELRFGYRRSDETVVAIVLDAER